MRHFIFSSVIVLAAVSSALAQVTNQHLYDTLPTMVEHYHKRLAAFRSEPVVKGKVIFAGNSITEGGQWHQLTDGKNRINRGIGGDVTFGLLYRIDEIIQRQPTKLFIMIGINDIGKDFPDAVIVDNYKAIVRRIKAEIPKTQIYLQSILPVNPFYPRFPQHYDKGDRVIALNKQLKELASSEGVNFVNLYPLFLDQRQLLDFKYTTDGLHLNAEGYRVWLDYLKECKLVD